VKTEEAKTVVTAASELSECYVDLLQAISETTREARTTKKLWRTGNNSMLIKVGLALIAFPDPTISDIVGSLLVAAGTVQAGIRRRTLYVDDLFKTFHISLREIRETKQHV
jgi:hypothetical protein